MKARNFRAVVITLILFVLLMAMGFSVKANSQTTGEFNVQINLKFPTQNEKPTITMKKIGGEKTYSPSEVSNSDTALYYHFDALETGEYELEVTGKGYITYKQPVTIENQLMELKLTNGYDEVASSKIGVIVLGDINGDHVIDEKDQNLMIQKIEAGKYDKKYDLNGDKKLDIIDLSYITFNQTKNTEGSPNKTATPINLLNTQKIAVEEKQGTKIKLEEGTKLEDVLKNNEKYITLAPTGEEAEISQDNPVEISLDLSQSENQTQAIVISPASDPNNFIKDGEVIIVDEKGNEISVPIKAPEVTRNQRIARAFVGGARAMTRLAVAATQEIATIEPDGTVVINLRGQVAIKRITIKVTETGSNKLADISKVEFLNNMEERIPAPQMDIPENLRAVAGSKEFSLTWDRARNVTGYEVSIKAISERKFGKEEFITNAITDIIRTDTNSLKVSSYNQDKIKNGTKFEVKVQSINGEWKSGYCKVIYVTPEPNKRPDAPDNVSVTGAYKSLNVTWKDMEDTDTYSVYYREYEKGNYIQAVTGLANNSYTIENLESNVKYQVYVTGTNAIGTSNPSIVGVGTTISLEPAIMPKYKLINTSNGEGKVTNHIKNVTFGSVGTNSMVDSPLDEGKAGSGLGIVDDNHTSYFKRTDWDMGCSYPDKNKVPFIEFDDYYQMSYIAFSAIKDNGVVKAARIYYTDKEGNQKQIGNYSVLGRTCENGRKYYVIKLPEPIETNKIGIGLEGNSYVREITIAEIKFYYHDTLENDINNLYADQMHVTLRDDVNQDTLDALQTRLDTKDSDEYHPEREMLQRELDTAKEIYNNKTLNEAIQIDTTVTKKKDGHITFSGGLNAWQPLGVVAHESEQLEIYVGNPKLTVGSNTNLVLIATQYHAESGKWHQAVTTLKVGKNEVTIPKIATFDFEQGGALYIEYTGNNANDIYGVRVSGGSKVPMLDVSKLTTEQDKKAAIKTYVEELEAYVPTLEAKHNEHKAKNDTLNREYQKQNCILGATDIVLPQMMYSVSAEQILGALKGTTDEKTNQLYNSLEAMNDMVDLFYSHKGLSKSPDAGAKNQYPVSRLNIRYHRMFAGAFMYAGGLHIGIEWGSVGGLATSVPVQATEEGKYESGRYFGWGIAHEIGHIINEGAYAVAEVTNNYFAVLAQAKDTNDSVRLQYSEVYKKVTSGTKGRASNVFTQLGLYWQLHLAYDKGGYNYKTFDTYQEQFDNLIFARMDTYARNVALAPKPGGVALTLSGDSDNKLMRLAVAAAQKDILSFFERWGMTPDATTRAYAAQFSKETRPIYYVNDEARSYELAGGTGMTAGTKVTASLSKENNSNQVKITLGNTNQSANAMLGYEIIRSYMENDKEVSRAVAFVTADKTEYIDTIETINNRVFTYKVIAYDKLLNATAQVVLDPIKISHDGSISKQDWTIQTNLTSTEDTDRTEEDEEQDITCGTIKKSAIDKIANNNYSDNYTGTITKGNGEITISLGEVTSLVALKYTAGTGTPISNYEIQISKDNVTWETVKTGTFELDSNNSQIVYFNKAGDSWLYTYDAAYVKLKIKSGTSVSIAEIDLLGQTGDNVELVEKGIGILKEDYKYGDQAEDFIPAGSVVFTGTYKGNPAYNALKLWDENNKLIEGVQIIFADVPAQGELGETADGIWVYYIEPKDIPAVLPKTIRAELYRVDDAHTNEGERLVSDTYRIAVPTSLPDLEIKRD